MDLFDCALAARPVALTPVDSPQTLECSRTPRGHYGNASSAGSATNSEKSGRPGRPGNVLTALKALSAMIAMIAMIAAFCVLAVPPAIPAAHGAESSADERARHERVAAALVEVHTHADEPDLYSPWQSLGVERYQGSGVVIEGGRILTAAHVVSHPVALTVKRQGTTKRRPARVTFVGAACDLAIVEVDDPTFFEDVEPLKIGDLPRLGDSVTAYGFPLGGDSISVTAGIVSRIEIGEYGYSGEQLLQAQVDAALNSGNSGGPLVADGRIVGIASEVLHSAENVGYVVPAPVIEHFLRDIEDGRVDGFPNTGIEGQPIDNRALRASLGLNEETEGTLVVRVDEGSTASGVLQPGDVLTAIDGNVIARDQSIALAGIGRIEAGYAIRRRQVGEAVTLSFIRAGKQFEREVRLRVTPRLVPDADSTPPSYLIFGGLVFQPLTRSFLELYDDPPSHMVDLYFHRNAQTADRSGVIILSRVLPSAVNRGYEDFEEEIIARIDGRVPRDLADLTRHLDAAKGEFVQMETRQGRRVVLDRERAVAGLPRVLERYAISSDRSPDLPRRP